MLMDDLNFLDNFINSLNTKGIEENKLYKNLLELKSIYDDTIY